MKRLFASVLILSISVFLIGWLTLPPLFDAAKRGDINTVKDLIDKGANVNEMGSQLTALAMAASQGHVDVAKLLVDKGANIDIALGSCIRFKVPYATTCREVIERLRTERNQAQTVNGKSLASGTVTAKEESPHIKSDVDEIPSIKAKQNKNSYAIVIGIEQYRQKLPTADYAVSDAKLVNEYLTKVMGYPEENVVLLTNDKALQSDLTKYFEKWLHNNVEKDSRVFIYYSGHGAPNTKTGDAYLVPYDGDPAFIAETGYSLKRMYAALGKLPAKEIVVALDSCFSGAGGRSVIAKGARPLVMNLQASVALSRNMTVLSASSGEQVSSTYDEKGHGLFTYFMLKGIKNEDVIKQDGSIKMDDLFGYIKPQVERIARKQYNNEQTPQLIESKKK
jgi:hypothetical protein